MFSNLLMIVPIFMSLLLSLYVSETASCSRVQ